MNHVRSWLCLGSAVENLSGHRRQRNWSPLHRADPEAVATAFAQFDGLWDVLYPPERSRLVRSLIATISYEATGEVRITLKPGEIRDLTLAEEATADPC